MARGSQYKEGLYCNVSQYKEGLYCTVSQYKEELYCTVSQHKATPYSWVSQYKDLQASRLPFLPQSVPTLLRAAKSPGSGALKDEPQLFAFILLPDPVDYYTFSVEYSESA